MRLGLPHYKNQICPFLRVNQAQIKPIASFGVGTHGFVLTGTNLANG